MASLTPGQIWLTNRVKQSTMTKSEIEAYINAGGKVLLHKVQKHNVTYGLKYSWLYTTEEYNDGVSFDLNYKVITAMINRGELWLEGEIDKLTEVHGK